jgi:hypothetical protein
VGPGLADAPHWPQRQRGITLRKLVMMTFTQRMRGAALLDARAYEDVEADTTATRQAVAVVLLASIADGIGLSAVGALNVQVIATGTLVATASWIAWAILTYLIGTQLLPEPGTRADVGQLLRTLGFASTPGLLRVFARIPVLGLPIYVLATCWMLIAMIVAVRQALDYKSTARAIGVCVAGWALSLAVMVAMGMFFAPRVS